ncbi:MAG: MarR family winged helix-turn-helix transcriptional regulator [Lachnospirales bacterium]
MNDKSMNDSNFNPLKLENQLCFPLYASSKEIIRSYKPYLDKIDLTYTQYIAMLVLWEKESVNVKELGEYLYLDSGTLTPVLKKLETKGLITRTRSKEDERIINIDITEEGRRLREEAVSIPLAIASCTNITQEEALILYKILYKILK